MGFSVKYNILLYCLLIIFMQALRAPSKSIPIKEVFSSGLRDRSEERRVGKECQ